MVANISVVMVSYQTGASLRLAVESVLAQKELKELILVDNGNPEETFQYLRELAEKQKKVTLLTGHGNVGFAKGCNLGVEQASGDYLLLLNPDCLLPKNCLKDMTAAMESHDGAWAAGAYLVNADGTEQRGGRRHLLSPKYAISESLWLYKLLGWERMNQHKEPLPEETTEVEAISGAFIFMPRERYLELEGMDENYFLHVEDLDFCRRIHDAGGKMLFVPSVEVLHLRSTSDVSGYFVECHKTRGLITYHEKFYPKWVYLLMAAGLWLRFLLKAALLAVLRIMPEKEGRKAVRRVLYLHEYLDEASEQFKGMEKPPYKDKTVLVTGASSQIGICTVARLLAGGAKVLAHYYSTRIHFEHPNLTWVQGDLKKGELALGEAKPDVLIHTAPIWLLKDFLSAAFNTRIKRIIAYSSTSVFVKIYSANQNERQMVKRLEEAELNLADRCAKAHASFTILRPTMIYGLGLDENVTQISDFARRYHFFPLYPPADGRRQPVHADDLAQIALKVMDNKKTFNKSYNIGGGEVLHYRAMVERIFYALGITPRLLTLKQLPWLMDFVGKWFCGGKINGEMARRMNTDMFFSDSESQRDFAFKPRSFLKGGKHDLGQW